MKIAIGIAKGLALLHEGLEPKVVHRDIKSSNILLDKQWNPKLSDFGLAKLLGPGSNFVTIRVMEIFGMTILEMEDWKSIAELVTNAKYVVSSVQDVARKLAAYAAKFRKVPSSSDISHINEPIHQQTQVVNSAIGKQNDRISEELFLPGTQYFLRREIGEGNSDDTVDVKSKEFYTLWRRNPREHFRRILLSGNLISDHKCENHYYALRDVLKGLPASDSWANF